MNSALFLLSVLALLGLAFAADQPEDPAFQGYKLCFALGQEYKRLELEGGSVDTYNGLVEQWNTFVRANYGENAGLLMQRMTSDSLVKNLDTTKQPIAIGVNTSSKGIVHSIDGSSTNKETWTTNDINALPESARNRYRNSSDYVGEGYLGWV